MNKQITYLNGQSCPKCQEGKECRNCGRLDAQGQVTITIEIDNLTNTLLSLLDRTK